ncbi:MAG TPA: hypothetical protein VKM55_26085 [Candidatus Lokiarchaeia archaeon]|nr:hypothetical protein [Candidatus Lokiarchaeia archaeon]
MKETIAIFDTNFFVALADIEKDFDKLADFIQAMKAAFTENNITPILPFHVMTELDAFEPNLVIYLQINFPVYPPVDINNDPFYILLKETNQERAPDDRWFNLEEVTDLEILTIANRIHDELQAQGSAEVAGILVISGDEGIHNAGEYMLASSAEIQEPETFMSYLFGISDMKVSRDRFETASKGLFAYFTNYRMHTGRRPIRQLDSFFSQMLDAIRLAREDIEPQFDEDTTNAFETFMMGGTLAPDLAIFEPSLAIIKDMLQLRTEDVATFIEARMHDLYLELNNLEVQMSEPTNYTRFYNYIAIYIIRIYTNSFTSMFLSGSLDFAFKCITLAKAIVQGMINQSGANRLYFSILMVETAFCIITGFKSEDYVTASIVFLSNAIKNHQLPTLLSQDQIDLLIAVHQCKINQCITIIDDNSSCTYDETGFSCSRTHFPTLLVLIEDFCDELASFGKHDLALKIYTNLHPLAEQGSDEDVRIEGKIYLECLILGKEMPKDLADVFPKSWEKTREPLDDELIRMEFTSIIDVNEAFSKRFKVLSFNKENGYYICWIYPLKSRFKVILTADQPELLKEFKIRSGMIKIIPLDKKERKNLGVRGVIEAAKDCTIQQYYYQGTFFTLDLI